MTKAKGTNSTYSEGFIAQVYPKEITTPVMTDKYHFTTAYGYWREGRADNPSTFYMFGRKEALGGGYSIAGGLEGVIDIVKRWQDHGFSDTDIDFLRSQKTASGKQQFPEDFLTYLKNMEFKLQIDAIPEGTAFFPQEPVLRVSGSLAQVKMLESIALGIINGHTGYITQAARLTHVLEEDLENGSPKGKASVQGLRRASLGAALEASRSLGAGGYASTSTGTAAMAFAQAFAGTMDHAWVMTHEKEIGDLTVAELLKLEEGGRYEELRDALKKDAFRSFATAFPEGGILLLDTYDPLKGLENAITVIKELHALGLGKGYGVRFDSGDIVKYTQIALRRFAEEGLFDGLDPKDAPNMSDAELLKTSHKCKSFVAPADGIDEHSAQDMRARGIFGSSYGVGTGGAYVAPVGLVYKASSVYMDVLDGKEMPEDAEMTPVMKVASNAPVKSSNPGRINSRRYYGDDGKLSHVVIYDENLGLDVSREAVNLRDFNDVKKTTGKHAVEDVLKPVFDKDGTYVYDAPPKIPTYPGSKKLTTDLAFFARRIKAQLATLADDVLRVVRPREEILGKKLLKAFAEAKKSGKSELSVDIAALEASLPKEVGHVPVYLDMNLFRQRRECEKKHAVQANTGVGEYKERFEGGNDNAGETQKPKQLKR